MENHIIIEPACKIREIARNTLFGNWKPVVLVLFIYFLLTNGVGLILDQFFTYTYRHLRTGTTLQAYLWLKYLQSIDQRTVHIWIDHVSSDLFQKQKIGRHLTV